MSYFLFTSFFFSRLRYRNVTLTKGACTSEYERELLVPLAAFRTFVCRFGLALSTEAGGRDTIGRKCSGPKEQHGMV